MSMLIVPVNVLVIMCLQSVVVLALVLLLQPGHVRCGPSRDLGHAASRAYHRVVPGVAGRTQRDKGIVLWVLQPLHAVGSLPRSTVLTIRVRILVPTGLQVQRVGIAGCAPHKLLPSHA